MTTLTQAPPSPGFQLRAWQRLALAVFALVLVGLLAFVIFQPIKVLPRIRLAPGFALTDQNGQTVTNEDLRGQFVLYNFTYTGCPAHGCPATDAIMAEVNARLGEAETGGVPVALVSIALDSSQATPAALQNLAQAQGAGPAGWRFLSSPDPDRLKTIVGGGFEVFYEAQPDGSFALSPALALVDDWGILRAVYRPTTNPPDAARILDHIRLLGQEVRNSQGVGKLGYEAAHLFLCYAP
ncbi:MAG: SCO family protein [Caldilineales bacterium]|nr:SCO family protein [Caldilineales bacterium]